MKRYKTDDLDIAINIHSGCGEGKSRFFLIAMTDKGEPLDEPQIAFHLPTELCKTQINDTNFVKHLLNFFIKE